MIPLIILAIADESDREFMIRLYERSVPWMYREVQKYLSRAEDVEDTVSDAVVKLVSKIDLLRRLEEHKHIPYAVTTARHLAYRAVQREQQLPTVSFDETIHSSAVENSPTPEEVLQRAQRNAHLQEIMSVLPTDDRLLLEEKYILHWSDAEIAKLLHIQPDSVRMRLTRIRRRIAQTLIEQDFRIKEWL